MTFLEICVAETLPAEQKTSKR